VESIDRDFNSFTEKFGSLKITPPNPELELGEEFDTIEFDGNSYPLAIGTLPHSKIDKFQYTNIDGQIVPFNGYRKLFGIEITERNHLGIHPSEIRKGCSVKVCVNGLEVWQRHCSDRKIAADLADRYISDMKNHWDWFPFNIADYLGSRIGYGCQESAIVEILVSKSRLLIKTIDDSKYHRRLDEDPVEYTGNSFKEVSILDPAITWNIF
jgi:hypothetical protein